MSFATVFDRRTPGVHRQDRNAARDRVRRYLLTAALLLAAYLYWRFMLRWFFLQRDDFWLVSITDDPYGQFDAGEFLWRWWHDWSQRNGRSADALVRALLRPGAEAVGWLAPAVLTVSSAAAWRWLPRGRGTRLSTIVLARLLLLTVVPILLLAVPQVSGNTVFWGAGIGNYVVPTGLALLAASWWVRPPRSGRQAVLAAATIVTAGALHELAALTVFAVTHAWWWLHRRSVDRRATMLIVAAYVAVVVGLSGPGRWRRLDSLGTEGTGVDRWLTPAARFTSELLLQTVLLWVAVGLVLTLAVVATWRHGSVRRRRCIGGATLVLWSAGAAAWGLARSWRSDDLRCSQVAPLADGTGVAASGMLLAAGVAVVATGVLLGQLRSSLGSVPLLAATGALATLPLPLVTGVCAPRVWYPPLVWALVLAGVLLHALVVHGVLRPWVLTVVTLVALALAGRFALTAEPALRANYESFEGVLQQIPSVQETGEGTIVFPQEVPHPQYGKAPVYRLASIACGFRTYYDVPSLVILDDGEGPSAGLPAYCPRPDDPRR